MHRLLELLRAMKLPASSPYSVHLQINLQAAQTRIHQWGPGNAKGKFGGS